MVLAQSFGAEGRDVQDKTVVNIAGDGCFRMNMNEIATAVRDDCSRLSRLLVNNHVLGTGSADEQDLFL